MGHPPRPSTLFRACCLAAGAGALLVAAAAARAGEWRITPRFSVEETYTDNVEPVAGGPAKTDLVTTASPGISVRGMGRRLSLDFDYDLQRLTYLKDRRRDEFRHSLSGNTNVEIARDVVFLRAQASISQQNVSNRGAFTGSQVNDNPNRQTVQTYNINPVIRHRFGNWADAEVSYSFSRTDAGGDAIADSNTNSESVSLSSGSRFSKFLWTLSGNRNDSGRSSGTSDSAQTTAKADLEYVVTRHVSALAGFGYEKFDDTTLNEEPDGLIWSAGTRLRPGPKTSVTVNYNDRFRDTFFDLDASYRVSSRTRVTVTYSESIQTSDQLLSQNLGFVGVDETGTLIDTRTGLPFTPGDPAFGLSNNAFRQKRLSLTLSGSRKRNSYSLQGYRERRQTDATGADEVSFGFTLGFSRQLTRRADTSLGVTYINTDFGTTDGRVDNIYTVSAGFSYKIGPDLNGSVTYNRTQQDSTGRNNNLTENAVSVRVQKTF